MVSRGRSTIIVETLDEQKKRFAVGLHDKITSLNDVSMYTDGDDTPLLTVFNNIKTMQDGKPVDLDPKKAGKEQLEDFMAKALPDYDRDRVYQNDIRKLITWYTYWSQTASPTLTCRKNKAKKLRKRHKTHPALRLYRRADILAKIAPKCPHLFLALDLISNQ